MAAGPSPAIIHATSQRAATATLQLFLCVRSNVPRRLGPVAPLQFFKTPPFHPLQIDCHFSRYTALHRSSFILIY